jgi:hypothetical protein
MSTDEPPQPKPTCEGSLHKVDDAEWHDAGLCELHQSGDDEARAELERRGLRTKSLAQAEADGDICIMRAESADTLREQAGILKSMLGSGELTRVEHEQCQRDLERINDRIEAYLS